MCSFRNFKISLISQITFIVCCQGFIGDILQEKGKSALEVADTLSEDLPNFSEGSVKFSLFNRRLNSHKEEFEPLELDGKLPDIWNKGGAIKVLIHGFTILPLFGIEGQHYIDLARAFGNISSTHNIILVDWTCCSDGAYYPRAARNTKFAGQKLAKLLVSLKNQQVFSSWDDVHFVGFSLGAHVSGIAGFQIQNLTGGEKVGRITGLDPAGPLFDLPKKIRPQDLSTSLDKTDAVFVDIIHCNMGISSFWLTSPLVGALGSANQLGHADFYPNGGVKQQFYCALKKRKLACSHLACVTIYTAGLYMPQFACPCPTWKEFREGKCKCSVGQENKYGPGSYVGEHCLSTANGKYFVAMESDCIPEPFRRLLKL